MSQFLENLKYHVQICPVSTMSLCVDSKAPVEPFISVCNLFVRNNRKLKINCFNLIRCSSQKPADYDNALCRQQKRS